MNPTLPDSVHFKVISLCLLITPLKASIGKLFIFVTFNCILLLMEAIMQFTLRREIFAFVGKPVLMCLDCVAISGPLFGHAILILESLMKIKTDVSIWKQINDANHRMGPSSTSFDKTFHRDFVLMSTVPLLIQIAVILATYREQKNWALGLLSRQCSGLISRWCVLVFIYYLRYMSDRLSLMAQDIKHLHGIKKITSHACYTVLGRLYQMKAGFIMVWRLHSVIKNRYEIFLVSYIFLSLCGLTGSMYFLGTRLFTRRFPYTLESALCLGPFLYTNVHISVVASDFYLKQAELINALQLLLEQHWRSPQVVSAIKSFQIQMKLANLTPTVAGHLKIDYSTTVLGFMYIATTYIFIFLFLN